MNNGIFTSVHQALHFAYAIEAYELSPVSAMAIVMDRLMKECEIWDEPPTSGINFDGLDPMEIRAQCAMIRQAVRTGLSETEAWAIQARFGLTEVKLINGEKQMVYSPERREAVLGLSRYFNIFYPRLHRKEVQALLLRYFTGRKFGTFRDMAKEFGKSHDTYFRAFKDIERRMNALESAGIDGLRERFEAQEVVYV